MKALPPTTVNGKVSTIAVRPGAVEPVVGAVVQYTLTPRPDPLGRMSPDQLARHRLLEKLRDDRADLVLMANKVRDIAQTVETAQATLAFSRRALRFLLLAGSVAAFSLWLSNGRRPRSALLAGVSMHVIRLWLKPAPERGPARTKNRLHAPAPGRAQAA